MGLILRKWSLMAVVVVVLAAFAGTAVGVAQKQDRVFLSAKVMRRDVAMPGYETLSPSTKVWVVKFRYPHGYVNARVGKYAYATVTSWYVYKPGQAWEKATFLGSSTEGKLIERTGGPSTGG